MIFTDFLKNVKIRNSGKNTLNIGKEFTLSYWIFKIGRMNF